MKSEGKSRATDKKAPIAVDVLTASQSELARIFAEEIGYEPFASGWTVEEVREILSGPELRDAYKKLGKL